MSHRTCSTCQLRLGEAYCFVEMTSLQSTHVQPKEFQYPSGDWTAPTADNQPASLLVATTVEASAANTVADTSTGRKVKISFDLSKPTENSGWGAKSGLCIRASLGYPSKSFDQSINDDYAALAARDRKTFHQVFTLPGNSQSNDGKLHFGLVDETEDQKGGLVFHGATFEQIS